MPALEQQGRFQKAVYWEKTGTDRYSRPTLAAPVELTVRWEPSTRKILDAKGNELALDVDVTLGQDEIKLNSIMWLGRLDDLGPTLTPTTGIFEVVTYEATPDFKNRNVQRLAGLRRYTETLPALT